MARMFIHHDRAGKILGVASVRVMPDGLPHPFQLVDAADGVIEVPPDDPAFAEGIERAQLTHIVDVAHAKLVPTGKRPAAPRKRKRPPSR
jgi:hypothetical protein